VCVCVSLFMPTAQWDNGSRAFHISVKLFSPFPRRFLYEGHEDFGCLPTFGVIPPQAAMLDGGLSAVPGLDIDVTRVRKHTDEV